MSIKRYCDFCKEEITYSNELPSDGKNIPFEIQEKCMGKIENIKSCWVKLKIYVTDPTGGNLNYDICKNCFKELVNKL